MNIKNITTYDFPNPGTVFGQEHTCGGVKPVYGKPPLSF
jgi:hypothetical protein